MNVSQLIHEVSIRPIIWDKKCENHRNRAIFDKNWDEIAHIMKIPRIVLKKKWKNLRDQFRYELKKIPEHRFNDVEPTDEFSTWMNFKALWFLKDQIKKPSSIDIGDDDETYETASILMQSTLKDENSSTSEDISDSNAIAANVHFGTEYILQNIKTEPGLTIDDAEDDLVMSDSEANSRRNQVIYLDSDSTSTEQISGDGSGCGFGDGRIKQSALIDSDKNLKVFYKNGQNEEKYNFNTTAEWMKNREVNINLVKDETEKVSFKRKLELYHHFDRNSSRTMKRNKMKFDEDEAFFSSLMPHMHKLSSAQRLLCKIDIQKIVYQHVYGSSSTT